jgi:hypothetical protein
MAFGLSLIRFLCRRIEAPLLSARPEKAVECRIELCASFRPSWGVGDDIEPPPFMGFESTFGWKLLY